MFKYNVRKEVINIADINTYRLDEFKEVNNKDWIGNKNSIFKTLGASSHTDKERQKDDFYATDPNAINYLIEQTGEKLHNNIWECSCGEGHLSERLKEYGFEVYSTDLVDRGYGTSDVDFLKCDNHWDGDILTNPPYKYAKEFIEHGMNLIDDGSKVIMFLKVQFEEGKARKKLFKKYPPRIYVSSSRILCAKNADFEGMKAGGGSAVAYAWYVFEKGWKPKEGGGVIDWIN